MRQLTNVRWPSELCGFVNALGRNVPTAGVESGEAGYYAPAWDSVELSPMELQYCKPIRPIKSFVDLREIVARIAALNPSLSLGFRGQRYIYTKGRDSGHALFPTLWREDGKSFHEKRDRLIELDARLLQAYSKYAKRDPTIERLLREMPQARWALLQHYGVCDTPMFDYTRSLQMACSFAFLNQRESECMRNKPAGERPSKDFARSHDKLPQQCCVNDCNSHNKFGYIYILGMPYQSAMFTSSQEEGLTCVSLLGVTPYNAKRPLIQDGFLACDFNMWRLYCDSGDAYSGDRDVDFSRRIVTVLSLCDEGDFWNKSSLSRLTEEDIYPNPSFDEFHTFLLDSGFSTYPEYENNENGQYERV